MMTEPLPPAAELIALSLGRYRTTQLLRDGRGRRTWLGESLGTAQAVLIKSISRASLTAGQQTRFEQEARIRMEVRGDALVPLLDLGVDGDWLYVVASFISGTPLEVLLAHGPLTVIETLQLGRDVFSALASLHQRRLLHQNVKPSNVIVSHRHGTLQAVLADFGPAQQRAVRRVVGPATAGRGALHVPRASRGVGVRRGRGCGSLLRGQLAVRLPDGAGAVPRRDHRETAVRAPDGADAGPPQSAAGDAPGGGRTAAAAAPQGSAGPLSVGSSGSN